MTRIVMTNDMVAHVWANQGQSEGRSGNGQFYFSGRYLYSYGAHYVAGVIDSTGRAWLNGRNHSITTAKHRSLAWRGSRHLTQLYLPDLPAELAESIVALTGGRDRGADDRLRVRRYLTAWAAELSDESGAALLALTGTRGTWGNFKARALADVAKRREAERRREVAKNRQAAAELSAVPLRTWRARVLNQVESWGDSRLRGLIKDTAAAHKAAGGKRIKAAVWARLKVARRILANVDSYRARLETYRAVANWRRLAAGGYAGGLSVEALSRVSTWQTIAQTGHAVARAHMPAETRARILATVAQAESIYQELERRENAERIRRRRHESRRLEIQAWRGYAESARQHLAGESEGLTRALGYRLESVHVWMGIERAARELSALPLPAGTRAYLELSANFAAHCVDSIGEVNRREVAARDAERARVAALPLDERLAVWRESGKSAHDCGLGSYASDGNGGAYIRARNATVDGCKVTGGELETSQGATVPLSHAFRLFLFVKGLRAAGKSWKAGGAQARPANLRVGHFSVDWISAAGDFKAGCHRINWPEIETLARALGLFDCEDSALATD